MARSTVPEPDTDHAFAALLQRERPRLLQFLRRLCGGDAEDVLQETLAKVWRLRGSLDPAQNPAAWLLQAAFRTCCDHRERLRRRPPEGGADPAAQPAPPQACPLEVRDELQRCLAALPPLERELLVGFHAHGRSLRELAAAHGLPLNTVKSHLHRARARLAALEDPDARS